MRSGTYPACAIAVFEALHAHVKPAQKACAAILIDLALIFTTHDTALGIRVGFDDISCFMPTAGIAIAIPRRSFVCPVEKIKIIERMPVPAPVTRTGFV